MPSPYTFLPMRINACLERFKLCRRSFQMRWLTGLTFTRRLGRVVTVWEQLRDQALVRAGFSQRPRPARFSEPPGRAVI